MTSPGLSARQLVEGMAIGFDPSGGGPPRALIEFAFTGEDRAVCHLDVEGASCRFEPRPAEGPTLRIETDAEVWRAVAERRLEPLAAVMDGRMKVAGDLGLFQRFPRLFPRVAREDLRAPPGQRAPGPVRLPAMAWLFVGLLPWKVFWGVHAALGPARALAAGTVIAAAVLLAREVAGGATLLERATAAVFGAAAAGALLAGGTPPGLPGASFLALGAIWAASVVHGPLPLTAEYARWNYAPRLWRTTLFRHPNALLTLVWGGIFGALAVVGTAGARGGLPPAGATALSVGICIAGGAFTRRHEAGARDRRIDDPHASLARLRGAGRILLAALAFGFLLVGSPRAPSPWIVTPALTLLATAAWGARWRRATVSP